MRHVKYLLGCVLIVVVCGALTPWIGILSYAVLAAALTICVGFWVAG